MADLLRADNFRRHPPTPAGCVVFLFALLLLVPGLMAVYVSVTRPEVALRSTVVIAGLACLPASLVGFWLGWRLIRGARPLDRHGPGLQ